jgi:hypothetical protein
MEPWILPWDWNNSGIELQDALLNTLPTLKTLYLIEVINLPRTLFFGISHLTRLQLNSILPSDFDGEQLSSLTPAASHTVIDHCKWFFWQDPEYLGTRFPTSPCFSHGRPLRADISVIHLPSTLL